MKEGKNVKEMMIAIVSEVHKESWKERTRKKGENVEKIISKSAYRQIGFEDFSWNVKKKPSTVDGRKWIKIFRKLGSLSVAAAFMNETCLWI